MVSDYNVAESMTFLLSLAQVNSHSLHMSSRALAVKPVVRDGFPPAVLPSPQPRALVARPHSSLVCSLHVDAIRHALKPAIWFIPVIHEMLCPVRAMSFSLDCRVKCIQTRKLNLHPLLTRNLVTATDPKSGCTYKHPKCLTCAYREPRSVNIMHQLWWILMLQKELCGCIEPSLPAITPTPAVLLAILIPVMFGWAGRSSGTTSKRPISL